MKKTLVIFIIFLTLTILLINSKQKDTKPHLEKEKKEELRGIFISYIELGNYIGNKTQDISKNNIDTMITNIKKNNFNTIILQIRSHNDAIYNSKLFKQSTYIKPSDNKPYDVLDYFIKKSKQENIKVYAWMNPYRIGKLENVSKKEWLNTTNIKNIDNTYYYNPASKEVINYLVQGVEEVINNYSIDALLFDDYFYPSKDIDDLEYQTLLQNNIILTQEEYHLQMVNTLIKKVYKKIKSKNKNIQFGISPDGNMENNYHKNYADVKMWVREKGYIDFIMPQLYYGFFNTTKPYYNTLKEWNSLITTDIPLYIALSFYKVGKEDTYAHEGKNEWIENKNIIKRQILLARGTSKYQGFTLFRYDNLFQEESFTTNTKDELKNVISILN